MKEKIKFKKGIRTIHFPTLPELKGESHKALQGFCDKYDFPKNCTLTFKRTVKFGKHGYDLTEIVIEK